LDYLRARYSQMIRFAKVESTALLIGDAIDTAVFRVTAFRWRERHYCQMLEAKKQLAAARTERDKSFYESKCATLDRQIDNLVYELYELTPEEIAIVEGSGQ
jgi:hypothetical protein